MIDVRRFATFGCCLSGLAALVLGGCSPPVLPMVPGAGGASGVAGTAAGGLGGVPDMSGVGGGGGTGGDAAGGAAGVDGSGAIGGAGASSGASGGGTTGTSGTGGGPTGGGGGATAGRGGGAGTSSETGGRGGVAGGGGGGVSGSAGGGRGGAGGGGGMPPNPSLAFDGFRYENPCGYVDGHSLTDGTCRSGEVCWPTSAKARKVDHRTIAVAGDAATTYDITLRIRGVMEPRDYPTNCQKLAGGAATTIAVYTGCDGYANQGTVTFNVYELKVDATQVYYLNGVPTHPPHRTDLIDQEFTIRVRGQTAVTFTMDDLNGGEIRNCSQIPPGVPPAPNRYDGNFFQLNVVSWKVVG